MTLYEQYQDLCISFEAALQQKVHNLQEVSLHLKSDNFPKMSFLRVTFTTLSLSLATTRSFWVTQ